MLDVCQTKTEAPGSLVMTGRYVRKPVPLNYRRDHPLPDHDLPERSFVIMPSIRRSSDRDELTARSLLSVTGSIIGGQLSRLPSHDTMTPTGYTTDASSVYSASDDEMDQQMTTKVHVLFEEIDNTLYEKAPGPPTLAEECDDWTTAFPHLRVVGKQILPYDDPGYEYHPTKPLPQSHRKTSTEQAPSTELCVSGVPITVKRPSVTEVSDDGNVDNAGIEETFAADGCVEEMMVLDSRHDDENSLSSSKKSYKASRRNTSRKYSVQGTSQACLRQNITDSLVDYCWMEFGTVLKPLIGLLKNQGRIEDPDDIDDDEGGSEGDDEDDLVGDVEDFSRRPTVINIPNWQGGSMRDTRPPSRDTSNLSFSRFTSASYIRRPPSSRLAGESQLNGLLTISSKLITNRRERSDLSEESTATLTSSSLAESRLFGMKDDRIPSALRGPDLHTRYSARQRPALSRVRHGLESSVQEEDDQGQGQGHMLGGKVIVQGKKLSIDLPASQPTSHSRLNMSPPPQKSIHTVRLPPLLSPTDPLTDTNVNKKRASPRQQAPGQGQGGEKVVQFRDATDKQPYHHQTHLSARPNTSQHAPKADVVDASRRSFTSIGFSSTTKAIGPHSRAAPASTYMPPFAGKALKPVVRLSVNADSGAASHSRADILRLHANDSNHAGAAANARRSRAGVGQHVTTR